MLFKTFAAASLIAAASAQGGLNQTLAGIPALSNLTSYLALLPDLAANLATLSNVTLLAPNNDAFTKLLSAAQSSGLLNNTALINSLFTYHVLNGTYNSSQITSTPQFLPTLLQASSNFTTLASGAVVEGVKSGNKTVFYSGALANSTVVDADHNFTGGIIHVIDSFLTLPLNISATLIESNYTAAVGALEKAGIASGPHPDNVTAFIPSNEAFEAIANIANNATAAQLGQLLGYHLVPNMVLYSTDLSQNKTLTAGNLSWTITNEGGNTFINNAKVIVPNVIVQEGVVHIIDEVLNPANTTATSGVAFASATSAATLSYTSGIPVPTSAGPAASATTAGKSSSSSGGAMPMKTGAMEVAALLGGAALVLNM